MTNFEHLTLEEMNTNQRDNLIKIMVKLQQEIKDIHWLLNYRHDNNQDITFKDVAELLNNCEDVLATTEYLWENRYEKGL